MTESPSTARPAAAVRRREGARSPPRSRPPRDEILDLSHRIHANPEPAFEEHQAAAWVAEALARPRLRRSSTRPAALATAVRAGSARRPRGGRATDRHPRRVRRAARARSRLRPQHDGGVRGRRGDRARGGRRRARRRDRLPRHAGGGAGERQAGHDRRRPVRGPRRRAPLPPLRPEPRRAAPLASRGRRRHVHRAPVARGGRPVEGPERARRDDRCCSRRSGCGASSSEPDARVHGIIQEGGTAANIIPDRTRAWFMVRSADQAVLRRR